MRRGLRFHQFPTECAVSRASVGIKHRQRECERKENPGQPGGELHQHIRGLCAENIVRNRAAKCGAKPFTLWPLHQDYQDHEQRHEHEERQTEID